MGPLIKQNGAVNDTVKYLGVIGRALACSARDTRLQYQGTVLAHRHDEAARRHRRAGPVSGWAAAQGRRLDAGHFPQGRRGVPQGRVPVRYRSRHDSRFGRHDRRHLPVVRRDAGRCQREDHGQERRRAGGTRLLHEARRISPARCPGVGRRHQQQVAGSRQGRADHEPAQRLGRRQAGRAASGRAAVDARHAAGPKGRFAPFAPTSGASGASARTSRRPRACWCTCRSRRPSRSWWRAARASTCRPSPT